MKADLKNPAELEKMNSGGRKLSEVSDALVSFTKPGMALSAIDTMAADLIKKKGGQPGFMMVPGYHWATCININEGIVHGIPNERTVLEGDVVTIDIGMFYQGFHTDMSTTFQIKNQKSQNNNDKEIEQFLETGKEALDQAINQVKPGNRIGHISKMIQDIVESRGYNCSRDLTGHGVGKKLHEYPPIPCFLYQDIEQTPLLKTGMTLAIEVIYVQGRPEIRTLNDGWTIATADGKMAAVFEKTIAVKGDGYLILTP